MNGWLTWRMLLRATGPASVSHWDCNEVIVLTDFCTFRSSDVLEPARIPQRRFFALAAWSAQVKEGSPGWPLGLSPVETIAHRLIQLLMYSEVFAFISITLPKWHSKSSCKKNAFNYLLSDVGCDGCFSFSSPLLCPAFLGWCFPWLPYR